MVTRVICPINQIVVHVYMNITCQLILILSVTGATTKFNQAITDVSQSDTQWTVSAGTETATFDCVVLTMPTPQILQLKGTVQDLIGKVKLSIY